MLLLTTTCDTMPASAARAAHGPRKGFNPPYPSINHNLLILAPNADKGRTKGQVPFEGKEGSMAEQTPDSAPVKLPDRPNLTWLRKQAKTRLTELRRRTPDATLAEAQFEIAKQYGFSSWRALKEHLDSFTLESQIIETARRGHAERLARLLDAHPDKLNLKVPPYEASLLFPAAQSGNIDAVKLLLERGLDVNYREKGDNTYAMHWVAAQGNLEMVRTLADAGGDVIGEGDDHAGGVIGWASCWEGCNDDTHRGVVNFLISRGARHHIFSAVAMNVADEVRRIVSADPSALNQRQSRNENNRTPLHFAVAMSRPQMVDLLLELGADPLAVDGGGMPVAVYATDREIDLPVMRKIHEMTLGEMDSAARGRRPLNVGPMDLVAATALRDWDTASRLVANPQLIDKGGALHLLSKRGDTTAVEWLLAHGANPNRLWAHWDADVTPLHLAAAQGHADVVRALLNAGANSKIRDSKHDGDAFGWAEFFKKPEIVRLLRDRAAGE
jgi:ankyrin repeat protein